jgi:hypothetical protein
MRHALKSRLRESAPPTHSHPEFLFTEAAPFPI